MHTIQSALDALDAGETTSRALTEACLARAADGEGPRVFTVLLADQALAEADAIDRRRAAGIDTGPLGGIPVSVKDLFDIAGLSTTAGSVVLAEAPPARRDALIVTRLRAAGAVIVGRTNMTEFAFSGLGLNPHYGTPANPWDRATGRIPGGSSSGAAVSVTDGMALGAIGTDTGGSVRIPAALCGITGFKPTARRVPLDGSIPLSQTLDSIGPLARSVACCRTLDAVSSGESHRPVPRSVGDLRLAVPTTVVLEDLDAEVARNFAAVRARLAAAGAQIREIAVPEFAEVVEVARVATFAAVEAHAWHRDLLARDAARYDPRVALRITRGGQIAAADYVWLAGRRAELMAAMRARMEGFDALLMPTVPVVAPPIALLRSDEAAYLAANLLVLRNSTLVNFLDGCGLSLPCHAPGAAPVGVTLARFDGRDAALLDIGAAVERGLAG